MECLTLNFKLVITILQPMQWAGNNFLDRIFRGLFYTYISERILATVSYMYTAAKEQWSPLFNKGKALNTDGIYR